MREVESPKEDRAIVVVIHKVPRYTACSAAELEGEWAGKEPLLRMTTLAFQEGDVDYIVDEGSAAGELWCKERAWGGQTVFTFEKGRHQSGEDGLCHSEPGWDQEAHKTIILQCVGNPGRLILSLCICPGQMGKKRGNADKIGMLVRCADIPYPAEESLFGGCCKI